MFCQIMTAKHYHEHKHYTRRQELVELENSRSMVYGCPLRHIPLSAVPENVAVMSYS